MKFIVSASTDTGNVKAVNQDCMNVQLLERNGQQMVFAILCDGMGGLQKGELAGASVLYAFRRWKQEKLSSLLNTGLQDKDIRQDWSNVITECNEKLKVYGRINRVSLGTTATIMLITQNRYYVANVGDSRAYEIHDTLRQITKDQSVVAREIAMGKLSPEQAESDPRRSILLQCIGASENVYADFYFGTPQANTVYMLCSDGFRHMISPDEIRTALHPHHMNSPEAMKQIEQMLIQIIKERGERDNITVVTIRSY